MSRTTSIHRAVLSLTASFAALAIAVGAFAQSPENYTAPTGPVHQPVSPYPVEMGFTQHHASTAADGYLRGKAAVIQSLGNYQLSESQAEILWQQARSLDRENNLQQTAALLAQKKMWADARIQAQNDRNARRAAGLQLAAQRGATVYRQAYQLSPSELDVKTGAISWPTSLTSEVFESQRAQIEQLFQQQFAYGDPQAETAGQIALAIDRWSQSLRRGFSSMPRDQYLASQKFLMGLKYSAAPITPGVAQPQPNVANVALATK